MGVEQTRMENKGRTFFKSADARGFLFFLLLTSIVAVLIKLSKEYTKTYTVPIAITNVPIDKTIKKITPQKADFNAKLNGFSLLMNSLRSPEIAIDFQTLDSLTASKFSYDSSRLNTILKESLPGVQEFSNFKTSSIAVDVDFMSAKKVPVIADVLIDFESGFDTYQSAVIEPDSVTVVGPLGVLEQIKHIKTKRHTAQGITDKLSIKLKPDTLAIYKEVKLSSKSFTYIQEVAKYTEGSFSIPVTIRGAQEDALKIFPREVNLFFVTSLEEYDAVLPTDFEVLADFSNRNSVQEFVVLSISRAPDNVRNVRLETKQVKFIVVN